jgi:DnaK suppressor protein
MLETLDPHSIRQSLEAERARLLRRIAAEEAKLRPSTDENPDRSTLAQEYASQERKIAFFEQHCEELMEVESALARLDEGTYGLCTRCNQPINPARLEVLPWASMCIPCKSKQEIHY